MPKHRILTDGPNDWIGNIWIKHAAKIYKQCTARTQSEEAAKDLFQDVALKFCKNARDLRLDDSLEGWFSTVVRTTCLDDNKCHWAETPMSVLMDESADYVPFPETASIHYTDDVRESGIRGAVEELLKKLSPAEKIVVEGTFIAGITLSEMSRDFGMSRCVLWHKREDALRKMRKMSEDRDSPGKKRDMPVLLLRRLLT